ncbi:MAG: outer membrane beta-barrel protein [Longimicrobiales bacterium]
MRGTTLGLVALAVAVLPGAAQAQLQEPTRFSAGGALIGARPQGDFRVVGEDVWGLGVHGIVRLDRAGWLALRADAGFMNYGSEEQRVPLAETGRILLEVNTTNSIAFVTVGPELALPIGPIRPYVTGGIGFAYLATTSSISGIDDDEDFGSTTHLDDATRALTGAAGVRVPVSSGPAVFSIDLGAHYQDTGRARYLAEGDIVDEPDGTISFVPRHSDADMLRVQLGVSVVIPRTVRR